MKPLLELIDFRADSTAGPLKIGMWGLAFRQFTSLSAVLCKIDFTLSNIENYAMCSQNLSILSIMPQSDFLSFIFGCH